MSVHFGQVWSFHLKATFSLSSSDMKKELERGLNYPWHVSLGVGKEQRKISVGR
jgi:hypothetical protein